MVIRPSEMRSLSGTVLDTAATALLPEWSASSKPNVLGSRIATRCALS